MKELKKVIKSNDYKIVHIHKNSASMAMDAISARSCGVPVIIGHSHNTRCNILWQHYLFKPFVNHLLTNRFACSEGAGEWIFGKKDFELINNAVDVDVFKYDAEARENLRTELGLQGTVIGFVGRLHEQKNISRILDIFEAVQQEDKNTHLLIIGDGPLRSMVEERAGKNTHYLGKREDVSKLMSAMDVFLLPSLYEGLPVVLAEAQVSGLPCVLSDRYPAIDLINRNKVLSLDQPNDEWARALLELGDFDRELATELVTQNGYNISLEAKKLQDFYLQSVGVI